MCRDSFDKVGQLLRDAVDLHGGALVATREEVLEHLQRELGGGVAPSAIDHFPATLRKQSLGIAPHAGTAADGLVVVLRDLAKYPQPENAALRGCIHVAPGAKLALKEQIALGPV